MAVQRGKDLLLKLDDAGNGTFVTVAGLRSRRRAHVSGSGVFRDAASDAAVRATFFSGALKTWQVVIPDFGVIAGAFQIAALEFSGAHDGELTFELTLESAGALTFTAI